MSILAVIILILAFVSADQLIKFAVVQYLEPVEYVDVIKNVLRFRYVENTGAIFGSFATHTAVLTVFSVILLILTIYFLAAKKSKSKIVNFCLILMISGGIGNIIDRIRLKYVVDFIEPLFVNFAVFNFADCLITVGAFALIIYLCVDMVKDSKRSKAQADGDFLQESETVLTDQTTEEVSENAPEGAPDSSIEAVSDNLPKSENEKSLEDTANGNS